MLVVRRIQNLDWILQFYQVTNLRLANVCHGQTETTSRVVNEARSATMSILLKVEMLADQKMI